MIYFPTLAQESPPLRTVPEEFPGDDIDFKLLPILAPFWANIDMRASGAVYYQLYKQTDKKDTAILRRVAEQFGKDISDANITLFNASDSDRKMWALVVTWYRVPPFQWRETNKFEVSIHQTF